MAVGQTITGSASPLTTIANGAGGPDRARIAALTDEWQPDLYVVGLPLQADGSDSDVTQAVRAFAGELETAGIAVEFIDERLSSSEAESALKAARARGSRGRVRKEDVDAVAAVVIAERWLTARQD